MSTHRSHRRVRRVVAQLGSGGLLLAGVALVATTAAPPSANAAGQSISTTTNIAAGTGVCVRPDGTGMADDPVNCNAYADKADVWLSNLPQGLPPGDYFFAVNVPGTQPTPNDGEPGLLSSDDRLDRAFHVAANGTVTAILGDAPHAVVGGRIQLTPFADTTNGGGVYNASVCALPTPDPMAPVSGSDCTHDSFKVGDTVVPPADPLTISKEASGSYTTSYSWTIDKSVDDDTLSGTTGDVTANYTVTVGHDGGVISDVVVEGDITITNPNDAAVLADVTDTFSDAGVTCTVTGAGDDVALAPGDTVLPYTCDLADGVEPAADLTNTASVAWDIQTVGDELLDAGSATDTTDAIVFSENAVDECADVSDTYAGDLGTVCVGDDNPTELGYSRTWTLTDPGCTTYPNTASFEASDTGATDSDSQDVQVCKTSVSTGAHTIGFWTNSNGQAVIKGATPNVGVCGATGYLRTFKPFLDLSSTATCAQVAKYATTVIGAAKASDMRSMLKAQMLGTALSVHYLNPALASLNVDLAHVDGKDVRPSFGGAASMTVADALTYVSNQLVGTTWYPSNNKVLQEGAKNLFDAINNSRGIYTP